MKKRAKSIDELKWELGFAEYASNCLHEDHHRAERAYHDANRDAESKRHRFEAVEKRFAKAEKKRIRLTAQLRRVQGGAS